MKLLSQVNQQLDFYLSPINLERSRSGIANQAPPRTSAGYTGAHSERKTAACVRRKRRGERWRCRSAPLFPDPSSLPPAEKERAMHIGVCMFNTDYAIRIEELARAAEERGFESLFLTEHTHIPASRRTPFPSGGELPREYSHTLDPFVALLAAAPAARASAPPSSATRSRRPRRSRPSISSPGGASSSGSAAAGTPRRWRITAPSSR